QARTEYRITLGWIVSIGCIVNYCPGRFATDPNIWGKHIGVLPGTNSRRRNDRQPCHLTRSVSAGDSTIAQNSVTIKAPHLQTIVSQDGRIHSTPCSQPFDSSCAANLTQHVLTISPKPNRAIRFQCETGNRTRGNVDNTGEIWDGYRHSAVVLVSVS